MVYDKLLFWSLAKRMTILRQETERLKDALSANESNIALLKEGFKDLQRELNIYHFGKDFRELY
jgi:hypothetical protein